MNIQVADWPAPKNISAVSTLRTGGVSKAPYDSNNLALHVGDNEMDVKNNRQNLVKQLHLPNEPIWLEQTHSTLCIVPEEDATRTADASVTRQAQNPLAIFTADCLPITLCNRQGTEIAAVHAGWRGLYNGIIENTLDKMHSAPSDIMAWIGPAISQKHYEVGEEVYDSFTKKHLKSIEAFKPLNNKWLADLPKIAGLVLNSLGINAVFQSGLCTYTLENEFYSYRRHAQTGRIVTLIWFNNQPMESSL